MERLAGKKVKKAKINIIIDKEYLFKRRYFRLIKSLKKRGKLVFYLNSNNSMKKFIKEFEKSKNTKLIIENYTYRHLHVEIDRNCITSFDYSSSENKVSIKFISNQKNIICFINTNCIVSISNV